MKMDDFEKQRDEQLIKEREEYEKEFFSQIVDEMIKSDALDKLISDRLHYIDNHFDFEPSQEYRHLEELYCQQFDSEYQNKDYQDYMPNNDDFDNFDEYDYPEGPDENIDGIKYPEPISNIDYEYEEPQLNDLIEMEESDIEDYYDINEHTPDFEIPDEYYANLYQDLIKELEKENMDSLIEEHINEEKAFFDSTLVYAIQEEQYFQRAIDELIFEEIEIDYEPEYFDYGEDDFWYGESYPADESIIDPFDSLGDIDYPEGEPKHNYEVPDEFYYDEELERDFEKYQSLKEQQYAEMAEDIPNEVQPDYYIDIIEEKSPEDEIPKEPKEEVYSKKRDEELIKNQEIIEEKFKQYIAKNDNLNKIIKEKLKEKKFK